MTSPDVYDDTLVLPILKTLKALRPPSDIPLAVEHSEWVTPERAAVLFDCAAVRAFDVGFDDDMIGGPAVRATMDLCAAVQKRCTHHERCYQPPPLNVLYAKALAAGYRADAQSPDSHECCALCDVPCADLSRRGPGHPLADVRSERRDFLSELLR